MVNLKEDEKNLKKGKEEQVEFSGEDKGEKEREAGRRVEVKEEMSRNPASSDGRPEAGAPHSLHVAGSEPSSVTRACLLSGNSKRVREEQELAAVRPQLCRGAIKQQTKSRPKHHLAHVARAPTCLRSKPAARPLPQAV